MAPTLEDLLNIPPDQITPQHVHMLGLAPDPVVPPAAAATPALPPLKPPAGEPENKPLTPPASPVTVHYYEGPNAHGSKKEPKEPKPAAGTETPPPAPAEDPTGFRAGTAETPVRNWEPLASKPEVASKAAPTAAPVAPNVGAPTFQPPVAGPKPDVLAPFTPPNVPEALRQTTPTATPNALTPPGPPPPIDQSLVNAPKRSLESFASREAEPKNLSLDTTAGGPQILDRPGTSGAQADILARQADEAANRYGSPQNHPGFLGRLAHVASRIGNIAGDIAVPGAMARIPGTDMNKRIQANQAEQRLGAAQTRESEAGLRTAQAEHLQAETDNLGKKGIKVEKDANGDVTGWWDKDGNPHGLNDPDTPQGLKDIAAATKPKGAAQKIAFHYTDEDGTETAVYEDGTEKKLSKAMQKETAEKLPGLTGDELAMFPPPQRAQFASDPEYAKARQDWGQKVSKYKEDQKIREAIAGRAPLQREYNAIDVANQNAPAFATPEMMKANPGRYIPAGEASKDLKATALVEDIRGAINNSRDAINRMGTESFNKGQRAMLAAALSSPAGQGSQYIDSLLRENLSEPQHDYVIAAFQLKENAMAMRSVLGAGQGSEELRSAITATLPGAGTPTKEYAEKQLNAFEAQLNRLQRGIPTVPLKAAPGGAAPPPAATEPQPPKAADPGMKWQHRTVNGKVEWRQIKAQ